MVSVIYPLQMRMFGLLVASNKVEPTLSYFEFFPCPIGAQLYLPARGTHDLDKSHCFAIGPRTARLRAIAIGAGAGRPGEQPAPPRCLNREDGSYTQ